MAKILYAPHKFSSSNMELIEHANTIIGEYRRQGLTMTLRQLYYQMVSRDIIKNTMKVYHHLASVINDARLAGLVDWEAIEDRTRFIRSHIHFDKPSEVVYACADSFDRGKLRYAPFFKRDYWANQSFRPEVWIEKDALLGVIESVCNENDVPYFSCRGYVSQSEMHDAALRMAAWEKSGQHPVLIHLGDHDPSGKDMTRDMDDRLKLFMGGVEVRRIALTMDQIEQYSPPPNPAKTTDSRYASYIQDFGEESWELDALSPKVLVALIQDTIDEFLDKDKWAETEALEDEQKDVLRDAASKLEADEDE